MSVAARRRFHLRLGLRLRFALALPLALLLPRAGAAETSSAPPRAPAPTRAPTPTPAPAPASAPAARPFTFAALGCLPYQRFPDALPAFQRLIDEINRHAPAFAVHLGDILASDEKCTDAVLLARRVDFERFATALVYTPGDNEWTDTHTEKAGGYEPRERLARLRTLFFAEERSLGQKPLALVTQHRDPAFAAFVENARWTRGGIVFATVHVVGSANNYSSKIPGAMEEFRARDAANEAWIRAAFAEARASGAPGIALFFQANPFVVDPTKPPSPGFARFLSTVEAEARAFGRPVLLVHADEHRYRLERGLRFHPDGEPVPNVTRLETFGENNVHGVLVAVDPASTDVFLPGPLLVPGNAAPVLPRPKAAK